MFWKNCQLYTKLKNKPDFDTYFYIVGQFFTNFQHMCCQLILFFLGMISIMMLYLKSKKNAKECLNFEKFTNFLKNGP
jgi:hypothetical protein